MSLNFADKKDLAMLRVKLDAFLKEASKEMGISITPGKIKYDADGQNCTLELRCANVVGDTVLTKEAQDFKRYAMSYGFVPEDLGRAIVTMDGVFIITGLSTRSPKRPIIARGPDGRMYKLPTSAHRFLRDESK